MNQTETTLETERARFVAHQAECKLCRGFNHSAKAMAALCHAGTTIYLALLDAEVDYITKSMKIPVGRSPQTFRHRAREQAIYGCQES